MNMLLKIIGRLGLVLTIVPSFLYLMDMMSLGTMKWIMIIGTVMWLVAAPIVQKYNREAATD